MEIIFWLDANEHWSHYASVAGFACHFELFNINKEMELPATHPNIIADPLRSTTINFGLCSRGVLENVTCVASAPFDLDTLGDHRGVIMDINMSKLLGVDTLEDEIRSRKLVMSDQTAVRKYLQTVEENLTAQNIFSRINKLMKRVSNGHTDMAGIMCKYEAIDKEVHDICTKAEKESKPAWARQFAWSPKLADGIKQLRYWRHRLKCPTNNVVLQQLGMELGITFTQLSIGEIKIKVQESRE